jgi:hypothetical protein
LLHYYYPSARPVIWLIAGKRGSCDPFEMAFEGAFRFHAQPRQLLGSLARDISHCEANG